MEFFIRNRNIVAFVGFTLFCIVSLSIQSTTFVFTLEGIGSAFMSPFQKAYDGIQGGMGRLWAGFTELNEVREELRKTREKLQQYESIAEELNEIRYENDHLRKILNLSERIGYESIPASIIAQDPDNWFRTLIINRGKSDGVMVNMPVVAYKEDDKAVVGKVVEVRGSISRILPIISSDIRVGIKLGEGREPGLLYGASSNANVCVIDYISRAVPVKFNEPVITSGQGGVFPAGLSIGTVIKSEVLESSAYQRIIVKPVIDFNHLEEVFIIKKEPDKELLQIFGEVE
ncbi:MAG TPA: rod shape-determining protein MreC [Spirochaetota bacterium]|nr:rod shape-determining protein MreC [Spirochaetota bacterium]HPI88712.1 rod shape-determining protein MreC [Spirochaetota bacterium]HPR48766.1 rod shape-determining protein MreC [Spirochaetota bacterium]